MTWACKINSTYHFFDDWTTKEHAENYALEYGTETDHIDIVLINPKPIIPFPIDILQILEKAEEAIQADKTLQNKDNLRLDCCFGSLAELQESLNDVWTKWLDKKQTGIIEILE